MCGYKKKKQRRTRNSSVEFNKSDCDLLIIPVADQEIGFRDTIWITMKMTKLTRQVTTLGEFRKKRGSKRIR